MKEEDFRAGDEAKKKKTKTTESGIIYTKNTSKKINKIKNDYS
jgi:hypothetical protein